MAIKITKKNVVKVAEAAAGEGEEQVFLTQKPDEAEAEIDMDALIKQAIDELAAKRTKYEKAKTTITEFDLELAAIVEQIKEAHKDHPADEPITIKGKKAEVVLGPVGKKREIADLDKIKAILGAENFMKIAKVTLTDLDAYLTKAQRDEVLVTKPTDRSKKLNYI